MSAFPTDFVRLTNGQSVTLDSVPVLDLERFQASIVAGVKAKALVDVISTERPFSASLSSSAVR